MMLSINFRRDLNPLNQALNPHRLRFFKSLLVALVLLFIANSTQSTFAQSYSAKQDAFKLLFFEQERFLYFPQDQSGHIAARFETTGVVSPIEFFIHPSIVEDLELSEQEVAAITSKFELARDKQSKLRRQLAANQKPASAKSSDANETDDADSVQKALKENRLEFFEEAMSELKVAQQKRLKQIQLQFLLYRSGYFKFLKEPAIQKMLHVSQVRDGKLVEELNKKLVEIQEQVAMPLIEKEKLLVQEALDIWLESLSEQQRKIFDRDWSAVLEKPGALGMLAVHLESEFKIDSDEVQSSELQLFCSPPILRHSANGNIDVLEIEKASEQSQNDGRLDRSKNAADSTPSLKKLYALQHLFRSEFVGELIVLLPEQSLKVIAINDEFEKVKSATVMELAGEFEIAVKKIIQVNSAGGVPREQPIYDWPEDMSLIDAEVEKRMEPIAARTFTKLLDVLLPHQVKDLKSAVARLQIRANGPLADIRFGELGKEMKLSESDMESLEESAVRARKFLCEKSLAARDQAIQEINRSLPDNLQNSIRSGSGKPIAYGHCDLRNFALALLINPEE